MKQLLIVALLTLTACQEVISEAVVSDADVVDDTQVAGDADDTSDTSLDASTPDVQLDASDCPAGTTRAQDACVDINECAVDANGMNGCGEAEYVICTNQEAAPPLCEDRDECQTDNGGCGAQDLVVCVNQEAAPPICEDIDECATDNGGCGDAALFDCINQEVAPPLCQPASQEPDLCDLADPEACGVNASCVDPGVGPADCACDEGYSGDGWVCAPTAKAGCMQPKAVNYAPWATVSSDVCLFPVTFTVDVNGSGAPPSAPMYVQGGFNDWCGWCMPLADPDGDGVWSQTYYLPPGNHEYIYSQNGWDNPESLPVGASCDYTPTDQYANRGFTISDAGLTLEMSCFDSCSCVSDKGTPVTFMVDATCGAEPDGAPSSVSVTGSFCDWCEEGYPLADPDGDGRWINTFLLEGAEIEYLYLSGTEGAQEDLLGGSDSEGCALSTDGQTYAHRQITLGQEALAADTLGQCAPCASSDGGASWVLQWSDEFDGDSLDLSAWTPQLGDGSQYGIPGWGNGELQSYKAENAIVSDGALTIRAKKESSGGKAYTSARLRTQATFTSGRIEARIKLPAGKGLWPAFWMLPENGAWPMDGEIDIMEFRGEHTHEVLGTIHYGDAWNDKGSSGTTLTTEADLTEDFHIYAIEWRPGSIQWFFDDQLFHSAMPMQAAPYTWPFDSGNFYLLLNLAIGGGFVDAPDATTPFPSDLVIDYVRVFSEDGLTP